MNLFKFDTTGRLRKIFEGHCNLSGEQYEEISIRFIYLEAGIMDGFPKEEEEAEVNALGVIFEFLLHTKELTLEEYNELNNLASEMWEKAEAYYEEREKERKGR